MRSCASGTRTASGRCCGTRRTTATCRCGCSGAEDLVERLQDELERDRAEDGRLQGLKDGLREAEEEKTINEDTYQNAVAQKDELNGVSRELRAKVAAADLEIEEHETKIRKAEQRAARLQRARADARAGNAGERVWPSPRPRRTACVSTSSGRGRRSVWMRPKNLAVRVCPRVEIDPGEDADSLEAKLGRMERDLQRIEREWDSTPSADSDRAALMNDRIGGSREAVAREAAETNSAYQTAKQQYDDLEDLEKASVVHVVSLP